MVVFVFEELKFDEAGKSASAWPDWDRLRTAPSTSTEPR